MVSRVSPPHTDPDWWRDAVVYQVYLRSFADSDGDGVGDINGLRSRLSHLDRLGVDAVWINPCYVSPQRDHGYDIADYLRVDPAYGTNDEFRALVREAAQRGIAVLMDMVANHCSSDHPWFRAALAAGPGSPERGRFHFADGRGVDGEEPPTNYESIFGGPAWTRVVEPDGRPGQWYLHLFDSSQPDLNWADATVREHFDEVLRFWFDMGVAGFRIDVGHGMAKADELVDWEPDTDHHPAWDQPGVHDIYRRWRAVGESYEDVARYFVGEVWVGPARLAEYLGPGQLHQAFTFDLLVQPWHAPSHRAAISRALALAPTGRPPAWTLSNHDVHRVATRYGQHQDLTPPDASDMIGAARRRGPVDASLGLRRARAAMLLQLALPGSIYVYQGEELGLPEVLDLADHERQDPIWFRSGGSEYGRDGCRVPIPWTSEGPSFGFSPPAATGRPWLTPPPAFAALAVSAQVGDEDSVLRMVERAVGLRRELWRRDEPLEWISGLPATVLGFRRGEALCLVNMGDASVDLPAGTHVVLASDPGPAAPALPPDTAAWLREDAARA